MRYVSTRGEAPVLGFDGVLLEGLARDGGLYVPERWPRFDLDGRRTYAEVAEAVIRPFLGDSVLGADLAQILTETYARFRHPDVAPLRAMRSDRHMLELFWGPTLSFKDYALQFVGAAFERVLAERGGRITVLGATSGDTGSAAIEALAGRDATTVVILYPAGRVSEVQRRQMTTVAATNVHAVAVEGSFDDCQALVKSAFRSDAVRGRHDLAAVNSINWARVMAQAVYYAWTWTRLDSAFDVAVPTGNFGNVLAADVARRGGVPIGRMIVGTNVNHGLVDLIRTGRARSQDVTATIAPAMDIQVPSNLERQLFELMDRDGRRVADVMRSLADEGVLAIDETAWAGLTRRFAGHWSDDGRIEGAIADVERETGVILDPHTAAGWLAAEAEAEAGGGVGDAPTVVVATAHPAKFPDAVERAVGRAPALPDDLADLFERPERTRTLEPTLASVDAFLTELPRS